MTPALGAHGRFKATTGHAEASAVDGAGGRVGGSHLVEVKGGKGVVFWR